MGIPILVESPDWKSTAIDELKSIVSFVTNPTATSTPLGRFLAISFVVILLLVALCVLVMAIGSAFEKVAKAIDAYKSGGWPIPFTGKNNLALARRQNICTILSGDFDHLAKGENWNDQYYTDLEGEVETQGGYYASTLNRLIGRKSHGLRRVPTLLQAIESSTERAILIVGEPGSGKSVALRHLGNQLAQRGKRSKAAQEKIPLYINLRELRPPTDAVPNARLIKDFVFDSISARNGVDASSYLRMNWDNNCALGAWFFLFDSFDEIAEVLHAPTGSPVIRQYAEAIRQFLNEVGACHGLLASREFKGPDSLPWQRFRILPLNEEKQDQLIDNTFLEAQEKDIVRRHLAESNSSLGNNPLFLSLLCRYVGDLKRPPENDYTLLSSHIDRLASLDPDYTSRRYGLTPQKLLEGADKLAVIFAENPNLGLTPTQDQIATALSGNTIDLENLLGALVYVKIDRSDVQEAHAGDRRFAFSHRRYQETLFVKHLARNPRALTPGELIGDLRWREYAATLLQTQNEAVIKPLLDQAVIVIKERAALQKPIGIIHEFGDNLGYYDWENESVVPLLALLQEGLAHRLAEVPTELSQACLAFLEPRWTGGDVHDRTMVVKYGGLLPQANLAEYLTFAFARGTREIQGFAFRQSVFVTSMPESLAEMFRRELADQVIKARQRAERLRLEALAGRLPAGIGAQVVLRRCKRLKKLIYPFSIIIAVYLFPITLFMRFARRETMLTNLSELASQSPFSLAFAMTATISFCLILLGVGDPLTEGVQWPATKTSMELTTVGFFSLVSLAFAYISTRLRSAPDPIRIGLIFGKEREVAFKLISYLSIFALALTSFPWMFDRFGQVYESYRFPLMAVYGLLVFGFPSVMTVDGRRRIRKLRLLRETGLQEQDLILRSRSVWETVIWLNKDKELLRYCVPNIRSLSRLAVVNEDGASNSGISAVLARSRFTRRNFNLIRSLNQILERRLTHALESAARDSSQAPPENIR